MAEFWEKHRIWCSEPERAAGFRRPVGPSPGGRLRPALDHVDQEVHMVYEVLDLDPLSAMPTAHRAAEMKPGTDMGGEGREVSLAQADLGTRPTDLGGGGMSGKEPQDPGVGLVLGVGLRDDGDKALGWVGRLVVEGAVDGDRKPNAFEQAGMMPCEMLGPDQPDFLGAGQEDEDGRLWGGMAWLAEVKVAEGFEHDDEARAVIAAERRDLGAFGLEVVEEVAGGRVESEVLGGGDDEGVEVGVEEEGGVVGESADPIEAHGEVDGGVGEGIGDGDVACAQRGEAEPAFVADGMLGAAAAGDGDEGMEGVSEADAGGGVQVDGPCLDGGMVDGVGIDGGQGEGGRGSHDEGEEEEGGHDGGGAGRGLERHGRMEARARCGMHGVSGRWRGRGASSRGFACNWRSSLCVGGGMASEERGTGEAGPGGMPVPCGVAVRECPAAFFRFQKSKTTIGLFPC